ncbi:MAG: hypothetical protein ABR577_19130 [Pyrinomonadaceae bacterium]
MPLTIDMPPELESRLHQAAAREGVAAADYARMVLEERLLSAAQEELPFWATATKEEWLQAFNAWMDSHDPTLPLLSDEAISRESMYGERG